MEALMAKPYVSFIKEALAQYLNSRRRILKKLAGVSLSESEAQLAFDRINNHKWYLSERLGRDVGLRVAASDYFENIEPRPPVLYAARVNSLPPRLPMMMSFGERV